MNLVLLEPDELQADGTAILTGRRARHVREVLRTNPGDEIHLGVVDGPLGTATVVSAGPELRLRCVLSSVVPPVPRVDLLLALPRPKTMNRLWPVLAALGVGRILVSNAWKTERCYFDTHVLGPAHVRAGLLEGLEQARDTRLPRVSVHRRIRKLVEDDLAEAGPHALRLVAHPGEKSLPFDRLAALSRESRVLLAVGPEGGWIPSELELLGRHGFETVSWGPRTLRTDTACIALLGAIGAARPA